jgi:hypothetical protein
MFFCSSEDNRISVRGAIGLADYKRVLAAIHNLTTTKGYDSISIDLSEATATFAGPMLALGASLAKYRLEHVNFSVAFPTDAKLHRLCRNAGWLHLLDPSLPPAPTYINSQHVPVVSFATSEEQFAVTNRLLDTVLSSLPGLTRYDLGGLEWAVNEVTDNVLNHSQSPCGGFVQLSAFPEQRRVELTVADAGLGIPSTLRMGYPDIMHDSHALELAVQEGVTRSLSVGRGNGLYGTIEIARVSSGYIHIHSGYGRLHAEDNELHLDDDSIPYGGSLVVTSLDCSDPNALGRALRFDGQQYEPLDVIDTRYATEDLEAISFIILRDSPSVGSRIAGEAFRTKVENLLGMRPDAKAVLDFTGMNVVSSSFADEVVGKLFATLGPIGFMSRVVLKGLSPTVRGLIDRALLQRSLGKSTE